MVTTNSNKKSNFFKRREIKYKQWCEIEQQNNKSESKNTTYSINKNTMDNTTIEKESELATSIHKINQCNTYNEDSHDIKSSMYKEVESIIDEATVSNNKYDDLGSDPISKE